MRVEGFGTLPSHSVSHRRNSWKNSASAPILEDFLSPAGAFVALEPSTFRLLEIIMALWSFVLQQNKSLISKEEGFADSAF